MPVQATTKLTKIIEQNDLFSKYKVKRDELAKHFEGNHHFEEVEKEVEKVDSNKQKMYDKHGKPIKHKVVVKVRVFPVPEDKEKFDNFRDAKAKILRFDRQSVMFVNRLAEELIEFVFANSASQVSAKGKKNPTYSWKNLDFEQIPTTFHLALLQNSPTFGLIRRIKTTVELQNKQKMIYKLKAKKQRDLHQYVGKEKDPIQLKNCVLADAENFRRRVIAKRTELVAASKEGNNISVQIGQVNQQLQQLRDKKPRMSKTELAVLDSAALERAQAELQKHRDAQCVVAQKKRDLQQQLDDLHEQMMAPAYEEIRDLYVKQLQSKHPAELKYIFGIHDSVNTLAKGLGQSREYVSFTKHIIKNSKKIEGKIQDKLKHLVARIVEEVMQQLAPKLNLYLKDARNHRIVLKDLQKVIGIWLSSSDDSVDPEFEKFNEDFGKWYSENSAPVKKDLPTKSAETK